MSDLLSIGRSGVTAYRNALSTVGENVSNAETEGYSRRTVTLKEVNASGSQPLYKAATQFGGVSTASIQRAWDEFKATDARTTASDDGRADARLRWLTTTETALNDGAAGVGKQLTSVFTAADALASDPSSGAARSNFLAAIDGAAGAMRTAADALGRASTGLSSEAVQTVDQLNANLASLSQVNASMVRLRPGTAAYATAADERDRLVGQVAAKIGVDVTIDAQGQANLTLAGSSATKLLDANQPAVLKVATSSDGLLALSIAGGAEGDKPIYPTSGALSGLIDVAATIADRRQSLDVIATQFAGEINDWQAAGLTDANAPGGDLVTLGTNGAASIKLATTATTAGIAVASADGTGNGNALALGTLRTATGVEKRWSTMVTGQAQSVASAKSEASAAAARKDTAMAALDDVTGVDLDREAADLLRFQQAYGASTKIIQVARETLQSILDLI
ncbi:flagellar hook-associated protein FlgK [Sphingomonas naphthae]|uniref:Flagellar hook-associated protein 1 n=1 Tax=Sphingomonas naphthae TaxID=1813468 RepID=A0ABY7TKT5_9SPHN|nr:flagellar hook-associated protein FlgK [Sphingomonas naphthae]WCT73648.1 flagellar hook-associated protein FlgK [Sphingomonas naphthae]